MKPRHLIIVIFSIVLASGGQGRELPEEHTLTKRGHGDDWSISAVWDTCATKRIRVTIYDIKVKSLSVNVKISETDTKVVRLDTTIKLKGATTGSDSFQVPSNAIDYTVDWADQHDPSHNGSIQVSKCAITWGDPHMRTFSGAKFNFQGRCRYTLVRDCRTSAPSFDISAAFRRRDPNQIDSPTRMVEVTARVKGGNTYTFLEDNSILVDGRQVRENGIFIGDNHGHIQADGHSVKLHLKEAGLALTWIGKKHEVSVSIGNHDLSGKLCGMLGDGSFVRGHDLVKSDGTRTFNTTEFAESWVIPGSCE
ncbi:BMP-binding endothelial regulator protein-like [Ptychodera flava]|uniref:BMP-binding endothelial regulator protein-like n=1 Tax=Ptychodera flava TaxID=63121 RepID=UPI00396A1AF5